MLSKCLNEFRGSDDGKWGWPGRDFRGVGVLVGSYKMNLTRKERWGGLSRSRQSIEGMGGKSKAEVANRQTVCWKRPVDVFCLACTMFSRIGISYQHVNVSLKIWISHYD